VGGEPITIGMATYPLRNLHYQDDVTWVTNWLLYSNCIMWGSTVQ